MDRKEFRIRDPNGGTSWINLLNSENVQLINQKNYFTSNYVEEALIELYERFMLVATNKETLSMYKGQPVFITGNDEIYLAGANDSVRFNVAGFVYTDFINSNDQGLIKTEGIITNTIDNWNQIISDPLPDGLIEGQNYFLSLEYGKITTIAPENSGQYLVPIGRALTKNHFKIDVDPAIGL